MQPRKTVERNAINYRTTIHGINQPIIMATNNVEENPRPAAVMTGKES